MVLDSLRQSPGNKDQPNPMHIARHTLFTAREKLDLLRRLKSEACRAPDEGDTAVFKPAEIDAAIAHVQESAARTVDKNTVMRGTYR